MLSSRGCGGHRGASAAGRAPLLSGATATSGRQRSFRASGALAVGLFEEALADADRQGRHLDELVVGDEFHRILQRERNRRGQQDGIILAAARMLVSFLVLIGFTTRSLSRLWMPMIMPSYSFSPGLTNMRPRSCRLKR